MAALRSLEAEPSVRGVLLGSALPSVFSAGLDHTSLHGSTEAEHARYWTAVQEMWLTLYMTPLATVASVGGHSPAGGCMLALSCDERVMVEGKPRIGLNETQLGIVAPPWFGTLLRDTVGARPAERMLQLGSLLSPEEALAAGMVDEVVPLHQLHGAASARLERLLAVPDAARARRSRCCATPPPTSSRRRRPPLRGPRRLRPALLVARGPGVARRVPRLAQEEEGEVSACRVVM